MSDSPRLPWMYCAVCGRLLQAQPPATCSYCGAVTRYEITTEKARQVLDDLAASIGYMAGDGGLVMVSPEERRKARERARRKGQ